MKIFKIGIPLIVLIAVLGYFLSKSFGTKDKQMDVGELRLAVHQNLPLGSDVKQVTRFLETNHIKYLKDYDKNPKIPYSIYGYYAVKHSWIASSGVKFTFGFDDKGKLTDSTVDNNTGS